MATISLSYLTSAVNARALLRFLLSSRTTRIRYRLASPPSPVAASSLAGPRWWPSMASCWPFPSSPNSSLPGVPDEHRRNLPLDFFPVVGQF